MEEKPKYIVVDAEDQPTPTIEASMKAFAASLREDFPAANFQWKSLTKCAACAATLSFPCPTEGEDTDGINRALADHAKVCEARPLEVGDWVRWTPLNAEIPNRWLDGVLTECSPPNARMSVKAEWPGWENRRPLDRIVQIGLRQLRRIPRPVDEVKAGTVRAAHAAYVAVAQPSVIASDDMPLDTARAVWRQPPTIETPWMKVGDPAPDPLDVKIDGATLRSLVEIGQCSAREMPHGGTATPVRPRLTPAQRAAISAHWSADLRIKVAASDAARKARETTVVIGHDVEDEPWR